MNGSKRGSGTRMPMMFVGHGSPTNAMEDNEFTGGWKAMAAAVPRPSAILCISAHWETDGLAVTAMEHPRTIHDFGGFPDELYRMQYPAPGDTKLADAVKDTVTGAPIALDRSWGLDHGAWVPIMKMYPNADIPIVELSLNASEDAAWHYARAKELMPLRHKGVLIIASGNMVHNLGMIRLDRFEDINKEFGFDWALAMNDLFKTKITARDHRPLIQYETLGKAARLAIPTPEHYLPLLSVLALQEEDESAEFYNDKAVAGSLTMTSVLLR